MSQECELSSQITTSPTGSSPLAYESEGSFNNFYRETFYNNNIFRSPSCLINIVRALFLPPLLFKESLSRVCPPL